MKLLFTGGTGFIGSNLMRHFGQNHVCENWARGSGDITAMLERFRPDVILNCAAEIYDTDHMFDTNVVLVQHIISWCSKNPCRLLHFGSSSEYGSPDRVTQESGVIEPTTVYGATKAAATMLCSGWARQHNLPILVARLYSPYGPGERPQRLFPKLLRAFEHNEPMTLRQGAHDFLYIDDVVSAVDRIINTDDLWSTEIVNICSGKQYTNFEILDIFRDIYQRDGAVTVEHTWSTPQTWVGDNFLLCSRLDWQPKFSIQEGISEFVIRSHSLE